MNRRWRLEAAAQHETLQAVSAFTAALPPLSDPLGIADVSDIYATYSILHAKSRHPQVRRARGFYYFIADAVLSPAQIEAQQQNAGASASRVQVQPSAATTAGQAAAGEPALIPTADGTVRYEAVVPVSSKFPGLTTDLMRRLFHLEGPGQAPCPHIMVAIVDDDGSVSLFRAFGCVQPPFEGPETLPPISAAEPPGDESDA